MTVLGGNNTQNTTEARFSGLGTMYPLCPLDVRIAAQPPEHYR